MTNIHNHTWDVFNNPDLWRHLMKKRCASCNKKIENTHFDYEARGNFCVSCNTKCDENVKLFSKNQQEIKFLDLFKEVRAVDKPIDTTATII